MIGDLPLAPPRLLSATSQLGRPRHVDFANSLQRQQPVSADVTTTPADIAIFVHLPWGPEIRQGPSLDGSRTAENRAPHKKEWVDNIFGPWHGFCGHRNFCPPTLGGGDPPRSLSRRLKDAGLPRSAHKRVGGQYFRSLARFPRTSQPAPRPPSYSGDRDVVKYPGAGGTGFRPSAEKKG